MRPSVPPAERPAAPAGAGRGPSRRPQPPAGPANRRRHSTRTAAASLIAGLVVLLPVPPAAAAPTCPIPFLAQGASATVAGVRIDATTNSGVQGDTASTYLHQSNARILTVLTFDPPVSSLSVRTRFHADAPSGFEEYVLVGTDALGTTVLDVAIRDVDRTSTYVEGAESDPITAPMSTLRIEYRHDTPIPDLARGSYLDLFLECDPRISPSLRSVDGPVGTPLVPQVPYVATGFGGAVTYAISDGTLPAGLALDPTTGVVSGVPTVAGVTALTVTATGATFGTATATIRLSIAPLPTDPPEPAVVVTLPLPVAVPTGGGPAPWSLGVGVTAATAAAVLVAVGRQRRHAAERR